MDDLHGAAVRERLAALEAHYSHISATQAENKTQLLAIALEVRTINENLSRYKGWLGGALAVAGLIGAGIAFVIKWVVEWIKAGSSS